MQAPVAVEDQRPRYGTVQHTQQQPSPLIADLAAQGNIQSQLNQKGNQDNVEQSGGAQTKA